jgi:glycosyltransferase involved in cell wall biosynthesis
MRVLHVIPSLSMKHGGPSKALPVMAASLSKAGVKVDVVTTDDDGPGCRLEEVTSAGWMEHVGWRVLYFPKQSEFYKVSLPLLFWLLRHAREYEVIHIHAVFSFATLAGGWAAWLAGVPFIVRPLGTMNTWGMAHRRHRLKKLSFTLLDKPVLDRAAALHCTSSQEVSEVQLLGLRSPSVNLPLGFEFDDVSGLSSRSEMEAKWPATQGKKVLLFLSRLDEKKGLECLLDAFAIVHRALPQGLLIVAGSGPSGYVEALKIRSTVPDDAILWLGHVEGDDKRALLGGADVFSLPSRSENFGIVLLEAMSAGLACITTPGVALAHEKVCHDALIVTPIDDPTALAAACLHLFRDPEASAKLRDCAMKAARIFSSERMADCLKELYLKANANPSNHEFG